MADEAKRIVTVLDASAGKCACVCDDGGGCVYDDNDCAMEQAAELIERLSAERDQWESKARAEAAKAKELKKELEAAKRDMLWLMAHNDDICDLCAHRQPCMKQQCPHYISGVGATLDNGMRLPEYKWDCTEFDYGTCGLLENTACNGCDFMNHFEWRGPCEENGGASDD